MYACNVKSSENSDIIGIRLEGQSASNRRFGPDSQGIRCQYLQSRTHYAIPGTYIVSCNIGTSCSPLVIVSGSDSWTQPDETHIAAGMSDGTLSVRHRQQKSSEAATSDNISSAALRSATFESFLGGVLPSIGQGRVREKKKSKPLGDVDEFRVESRRKKRLREYDRLLKNFKYSAALDSVLRKVCHLPHVL